MKTNIPIYIVNMWSKMIIGPSGTHSMPVRKSSCLSKPLAI